MISNIESTATAGLYSWGYNIGKLLLMVNNSMMAALNLNCYKKYIDTNQIGEEKYHNV